MPSVNRDMWGTYSSTGIGLHRRGKEVCRSKQEAAAFLAVSGGEHSRNPLGDIEADQDDLQPALPPVPSQSQ